MSIREEYINAGYANKYIDERAKEEYEYIVSKIEKSKKKFTDTKIVRFLCTDWSEYLINKLARYYYLKKHHSNELPEFTGDRNNPVEVFEYNQRNGIKPIETKETEDGVFIHKYEDGTVVHVKTTLTGIIDGNLYDKMIKDRKRFIADYLKIDEEEIENMNEFEIENLVKKNELKRKVNKVLRLNK